jgi:hypothetical protein
MEGWQHEMHDAVRREMWSLRGPMQIVKVVPRSATKTPVAGGYITVGKFLLGKTPEQIERALGLPRDYLLAGARVYRFTRLPFVSEYEYELTAAYPDGLAFNPSFSHPAYPPGNPTIHQWRIKQGVQIPVDLSNYLELPPGKAFPYDWLVS